MRNLDSALNEVANKLESEANEKVNKAISLFNRCDNEMKQVVLHATGFKQKFFCDESLRKHFDTMDLLDSLDSAIEDMQWDIEHNNQTDK